MRQRSTLYCLALFLVVLVGCSKDPTPAPAPAPAAPDLKVGTVQAALTNPASCPATGACTIYPDKDTTVYSLIPT